MNTWNDDDVEAWLSDNPLPPDFEWNREIVRPRYQLKQGFGQWLRTAGSYHPALRGLFRRICEIVFAVPDGADLPTMDQLVAELHAQAAVKSTLGLEFEDTPPPSQ